MNDIAIDIREVTKTFQIIKKNFSTLQILQSLMRGKGIREKYRCLDRISCVIKKGERVGLLGENGCGKTTLLRLLSGIYLPSSGRIVKSGSYHILFSEWGMFNIENTVLDNFYLMGSICGISRDQLSYYEEDVLRSSGLYELRFVPVKDLSSGQKRKFALSVFFLGEADMYFFDEVWGSVDARFEKQREDFFQELIQKEKTIVMTSHHHPILEKYCNRAIWIHEGRIQLDGSVSDVVRAYEESL